MKRERKEEEKGRKEGREGREEGKKSIRIVKCLCKHIEEELNCRGKRVGGGERGYSGDNW